MARECVQCGGAVRPTRRREVTRYCSNACRQKAYRARNRRLPAQMTSQDRWVRYDARKVPLTASGRFASVRDPETWSSYDEASASTVGEGVGYMLGNGIGCIDLDNCILDDGTLHPVAERILRENRRAALLIEISRSRRGLHVFRPMAEEAGSMRIIDGQDVEIYSRDRYIAMTGEQFSLSRVNRAGAAAH